MMNRGRRREDIFEDDGDFRLFLEVLKDTAKMWNLKVSAYCLMSNHYHLLVQTPDGNLSRCMRHLNGVYTQRYNRKHGLDGQLFRGRYKSVLVEEDHYLLELLRYIHRNPVAAGMVEGLAKNVFQQPQESFY
ncbi:MAG: transposase [Deltaproteobacteria bacterium]|nr:transposase [Deltaproteobacteria bacterium]